MVSLREKVVGMFLGIGIGDALGMPVETMTADEIRNRFGRVTTYMDMPDDHKWHHNLKAGQTTDDTQLTLAVARAIIKSSRFDMDAIAAEHVAELDRNNATWGPSTRNAVKRIKSGVSWELSGKTDKPNTGLGNGVVMKLAPLAVCELTDNRRLYEEYLADFTRMTHTTNEAVLGTFIHFAILRYLLKVSAADFRLWPKPSFLTIMGGAFNEAIAYLRETIEFNDDQIESWMRPYLDVFTFPVETIDDPGIISLWPNTFLVHDTLGLAYAFFMRSPGNVQSLYDAVNAGGDTDSTGSIVGGMLGALNGPDVFPDYLRRDLKNIVEIVAVANQLCDTLGIE